MPPTRLSHDEQVALAQEELTRLGSLLEDLSVVVTGPDHVSFHPRQGAGWPAKVIAYDAVGEAVAKQLVATEPQGRKVVVANRISGPARKYLADQQWAWLDRRIGAHIPIGRRDIEVRYAGPNGGAGVHREPGRPAGGPIRGRAGIAYAAELLRDPDDPPSFRSVAAAVGMTPTAISNAVKQLAEAGLVGPGNKPTLPDLFWALADAWQPLKVFPIASIPDPADPALATRADRLDEPGWVLGGDLAAAELGAPVFSVEQRPWLWVPTQVELRRAERTYGPATWEDRAAVIAAPPTALVCRHRRPSRSNDSAWPLPHPLFAALDLARDPGRGREILAQWSPEGADAVWQ